MLNIWEEVRRNQREFIQLMSNTSRYRHKKCEEILTRSEELDINGRAYYQAIGIKIPAYFVETSSDFEDITENNHSLFRTDDGVKVFKGMKMYRVKIKTNKVDICFKITSLEDYDPTKFKYFDQYYFLTEFIKSNGRYKRKKLS